MPAHYYGGFHMRYQIVGANIDTWLINVKGKLPDGLADELDFLKEASQEADEDIPTRWSCGGETLFIRAHGSGRQWRWILHCPSPHLDIGRGKLNHIVGKVRLFAAFLWEHEVGEALHQFYSFLVGFYGQDFTLQVSEVQVCADIAGWELPLDDAPAFITRGHRRKTHSEGEDAEDAEDYVEEPFVRPSLEMNMTGRRCGTLDFSKGAAHSCTIYDKTKEITVSRKDWMQEVWTSNGWDGESRGTRVEFRYKRECLREMGVEEAYAFLDQLPSLWAYSTTQRLRHTISTTDRNKARWPTSLLWEAVQQATFFGDGVPAVRERKTAGDLLLICQMLAGCSTTASALLTNALQDDGTHFLIWFMNWLEGYLEQKGISYEDITETKRLKLGVVVEQAAA
jgi:hypothetical protein